MITIDGSEGEGGGQLLRMTVALSALTGRPARVTRIRAGRRNPGLKPQHVTAVRVVAALSGATVEGLETGSGEIVFRPGPLRGGRHEFDTGTAGSLTLVIQACLPVALRAPEPITLHLTGGTDVRWSPPYDYLAEVILPFLQRLGLRADMRVLKRGYFPRGGGVVELTTYPSPRPAALGTLERGPTGVVRGYIHTSRLPADISRRMHRQVRNVLERDGRLADWPVTIDEQPDEGGAGAGGAAVVWALTGDVILGASALAMRGRPSEKVGTDAAEGLLGELRSGATLDLHAADQLPVYLLQADAPSSYLVREATSHLRTMAWLLPQFLGGEVALEPQGPLVRVTCRPGDPPTA